MKTLPTEFKVTLTHSCGHTTESSMWGEEDFEKRKSRLAASPCATCLALNSAASGMAERIYGRTKKHIIDVAKRFDKFFDPNWRTMFDVNSPTAFLALQSERNKYLTKIINCSLTY